MKSGYVIGIDAGGTKVAYGLFNPAGERIDRDQHPTDVCATGESFSDTLVEHIFALLERNHMQARELLAFRGQLLIRMDRRHHVRAG